MLTLSFISNGLLSWFVSHTSIDWNSELVVFNTVNEWDVIVNNCPNCLLGIKINKTLDAC